MTAPTFGIVLPPSTAAGVPAANEIFGFAEAADKSTLDYLWVPDHILWWHPMHECLTLLAALAARTKRIRIGSAVLLLAMRNPVVVAKTLATIDRLCEGRLTVGVGVGGEFRPEWDAVGIEWSKRAARTNEMLASLAGLWNEGPFTMKGRHVSLDAVDLQPKPMTRPPIWIGGRSDAALVRAAKYGDGWMGIFLTAERYAEQLSKLNSSIHPSLYVWTCIADDTPTAREQAAAMLGAFYNIPFEKLEKFVIVGSPEDCAKRFREYADAGVQNFAVAPITPDASTDQLLRLTQDVIPLL